VYYNYFSVDKSFRFCPKAKDSAILTRDDASLISALQIAPRAPWSDIGAALGISGVTAARRWERVSRQGLAWVTTAPGLVRHGAQSLAYVEVDCPPARRNTLATELSSHTMVLTVELTTGSADIFLTTAAANLTAMSHYLLDHLSHVDGIVSTRARLATHIFAEASHWRLSGLERDAVRLLERSRDIQHGAPDDGPVEMTAQLQRIAELLNEDGRASYASLAAATGMSATSVRRYVYALLRSRTLLPRTDVAAEHTATPVQVYFFVDAPVAEYAETAKSLTKFREIRVCATLASSPGMMICAWLHTVEELHRLEVAISTRLPKVHIADRLVVLRTVKRQGRLVDSSGRATGTVPVNIWDDRLEHSAQALVSLE